MNERIRRLDDSVGRNGAPPVPYRISATSGLPMAHLHLLPSAPGALIDLVYAHIIAQLQEAGIGPANLRRHKVALRQERAAIEEARESVERSYSPVHYPWKLLHTQPDAPTDILDVAYDFWRTMLEQQRSASVARLVANVASRVSAAAATARSRLRFAMPRMPAIQRPRMSRRHRPADPH